MVPPEYKEDVMAAFLDDVSDDKLRSGEIGLRYLFNTLHDANRPDLVLQMARQDEHPSYMRFPRQGETTLLEFWQDECRSKCHDMLGSILEWLYVAILGLKSVEDGYRKFTIAPPYTLEFESVIGTVECPYGEISISFHRLPDQSVVLDLIIPMSTTATMLMHESSAVAEVTRDGGETVIKEQQPAVVLGYGKYKVHIKKEARV
jgi:hypothetical protein